MRVLRRVLFWLVDLAAIVVVIACILQFARHRSVTCSWAGSRASCDVEAEDSLGRVQRAQIEGIRGAAYRTGNAVGLVTDARNKDDLALFGTRMIEVQRLEDAQRLYAFADDRAPQSIAIASGIAHPRWLTAALLGALLAYALLTRRGRKADAHV
jgi:uncharacterized membrane protein